MADDEGVLTKWQKIELVMDQFEILWKHAAAEAGWTEAPAPIDEALDKAYRLLDQFIPETDASPEPVPLRDQQTKLMITIMKAMVELRNVAATDGGNRDKEESIMHSIRQTLSRFVSPRR